MTDTDGPSPSRAPTALIDSDSQFELELGEADEPIETPRSRSDGTAMGPLRSPPSDTDSTSPPSHRDRFASPPSRPRRGSFTRHGSHGEHAPRPSPSRVRPRSFDESPPFSRPSLSPAHSASSVLVGGSSPSGSGGGLLDLRHAAMTAASGDAALALHAATASPSARVSHAFVAQSHAQLRSPPPMLDEAVGGFDEPWPEPTERPSPGPSPTLFPPMDASLSPLPSPTSSAGSASSSTAGSPFELPPSYLNQPSPGESSHMGHSRRHSYGFGAAADVALRRRGSLDGSIRRRDRTQSEGSPSSPVLNDFSAHAAARRRARSSERPRAGATTPPPSLSGRQSPVSPANRSPKPLPLRHAHLAMPPPSGYDLSDDADASDNDSEASSRQDDDDDGSAASDDEQSAVASARHRWPELSPMAVDADPAAEWGEPGPLMATDDGDERDDRPRSPHSAGSMPMERIPTSGSIDRGESDLSVLEHIFIYSKSEHREHRVAVTRALPECIEQVDICEAVEYVLPLLNGLAVDDDAVKLGLASGLDRLMWTFYSSCPLAELDESGSEMDVQPNGYHGGVETETPVERPRISANAFVPLLGLFAMESHMDIASAARSAFVTFFCKLAGVDPPEVEDVNGGQYGMDEPEPALATLGLHSTATSSHGHLDYAFAIEARDRLRLHLLEDVVLGLARLDPELEPPAANAATDAMAVDIVRSPPPVHESPNWGAPLRSFALPDPPSHSHSQSGHTPRHSHELGADESTAGKLVALDLIIALTASDCLSAHVLESVLLPEAVLLARHDHVRVRSAACNALATLAAFGIAHVESPSLLDALGRDQSAVVRSAACAALPSFVGRIPRAQVVAMIRQFAVDDRNELRHALLEASAQLIHALAPDVPSELIDCFVGVKPDGAESGDDDDAPFAPLGTALDEEEARVNEDEDVTMEHDDRSREGEEAAIRAYNLPAVVLALGPNGWPRLRPLHAELCASMQLPIRRTLAASLHAIASIIGPQQTATDLIAPFRSLLAPSLDGLYGTAQAQAIEDGVLVSSVLLRHLASFLAIVPGPASLGLLGQAHDRLIQLPWRPRQDVAEQLGRLAALFGGRPEFDILPLALMLDPTAAVRSTAVASLIDVAEHSGGRTRLFLRLYARLGRSQLARERTTFVACVRSLTADRDWPVDDAIDHLHSALVQLATDPVVDVRLALARLLPALPLPPRSLDKLHAALAADPTPIIRSVLAPRLTVQPPSRSASMHERPSRGPASLSLSPVSPP